MFLLNPFVSSQTQSGYALDPAKVKLLLHLVKMEQMLSEWLVKILAWMAQVEWLVIML